MAIILSLETSTDVCSVALHDNGTLVAGTEIHEPQSHAAQLPGLILNVLKTATLDLTQVQAVAVTNGPGSYTGLRIGTSTAKGLCYALDIPLIALGSLELLAFQAKDHNTQPDLLCPMLDARRMEVYCLVADKDLRVVQPVSAMVIDDHSFEELLEGNRMLFFGNGAEKCRSVLQHPNAVFIDNIFPLAASLGIMAEEKYKQSAFEDLIQFKPFYLKEFVAKRAETGA
jgi:tRNA threonylcarbamoyladenosine biosynthesis protein TsaB